MLSEKKQFKTWFVTGTFHGMVIYTDSEGDARRVFHKEFNGESIIHIKSKHANVFLEYI